MTDTEIEKMVSQNMAGLPFSPKNVQLYHKGLECAFRFQVLALLDGIPGWTGVSRAQMRKRFAMDRAKWKMQEIRGRE
ncbi:MAG: hypothetical protein PHX68_02315 [Alphaproteobacteria bacterium]|nr:hypothetical protein [Alphaproteobacteria bacterium]